jgi:DNA-binding transcriptional MerR regulator
VNEAQWTLDELARRARHALAADGVRAPNGRVREVGTDGRAIRWYAMKGLVDRPVIGAGHAARYGLRHLTQLVAVKRLQAQGKTLAEIQTELAGATDETLTRIAALSPDALAPEPPTAAPVAPAAESAPEPRFWARPAAAPAPPAPVPAPAPEVRYTIPLTPTADVTLTLPAHPDAADLAAIRAAAAPLLDLLAARGLTTTDQGD